MKGNNTNKLFQSNAGIKKNHKIFCFMKNGIRMTINF